VNISTSTFLLTQVYSKDTSSFIRYLQPSHCDTALALALWPWSCLASWPWPWVIWPR